MMAEAPEIRILSAGAPKAGILACAEAHMQASGDDFRIDFATAPEIEKLLIRKPSDFDLVVAPSHAFDDGPVAHATLADTRVLLGSIETGIAVRKDAPDLKIGSSEDFRRTLVSADTIIYNRASSGAYIEAMIKTLGLSETLADRTTRTDTGREAMMYLAESNTRFAIAFGQSTEIKRLGSLGIRLAGTLPDPLSKTTTYNAALTIEGSAKSPARRLMVFLRSHHARNFLIDAGLT